MLFRNKLRYEKLTVLARSALTLTLTLTLNHFVLLIKLY